MTFTTDFGVGDGYAGAMKGVVLSLAPAAQLVDITHGVPAAWTSRRARSRWPRRRRCSRRARSTSRSSIPAWAARAPTSWSSRAAASSSGPTTACCRWRRGRPAGSTGSKRRCSGASRSARPSTAATCSRRPRGAWRPGPPPRTSGPSIDAIVELGSPPLHKQGGVVEGQVIHVDSFGNLITSLPAELFAGSGAAGAAEVQVEVEGAEGRFRPVFGRTFSDVQSGALIAYIGSGGQLEIARRDGSAAARMGAGRGTPVRVTLTT